MIQFRLTARTRTSLELKMRYALDPDRSVQRYQIRAFIFVPKVLGVTRHGYTHKHFYADTNTFIRLTTPAVELADLAQKSVVKPWASEIKRHAKGEVGGDEETPTGLRSMKLLGCIFKSALAASRLKLFDEFTRSEERSSDSGLEPVILQFLEDLQGALRRLRKVGRRAEGESAPEDLREAWRAVDEYSTFLAEEALTGVIERLERLGLGEQGYMETLKVEAIGMYQYRRERGYPSYVQTEGNNEHLPRRWTVLKRYIQSALSIRVGREQTGLLLSDMIGMLAAAIAMLFATVALVYIQRFWATSISVAFLTAMIIAYVIKDRTKEWVKRGLGPRLSRKIADHRLILRSETTGQRLGTCLERFDVISLKGLPKKVRAQRIADFKGDFSEKGHPESIMVYDKNISLEKRGLESELADVNGLTDVLRFDFHRFLTRMGSAWETYHYVEPKSATLRETSCARIYPIDVLLQFKEEAGRSTWSWSRVIMSAEGIQRMESVGADDAFGSTVLEDRIGEPEERVGEDSE